VLKYLHWLKINRILAGFSVEDVELQLIRGASENAGRENDGPSNSRGMQMQDIKMQDLKCRT